MNILVIDGQGGGIGKQLIAAIKKRMPNVSVMAVGTNSSATSAMLKAGADNAATGENAVIVGCRTADIIVGPVSIVVADSMLGEVTPPMAAAIGQSPAKRILIPVNRCNNYIVGISDLPIGRLVQAAVDSIQKSC
ncbi:MAG TPA: hypothetical protein DEP27_03945 [Ruminococcaceae bacterium]|jgi:prephenate dehydrogenase|nr:hypothetical protein [Oscillospiraceae bacterium]